MNHFRLFVSLGYSLCIAVLLASSVYGVVVGSMHILYDKSRVNK